MSTGNLTAALHLVLDDKISAGLKIMTKQLDGLRDAGKQIGLGKLTSGLDELKRGTSSAKTMRDMIVGIGTAADRTGTQIKRMAQDLAFAAKYHATLGAQDMKQRGQNFVDKVGVIGGVAAGYSVTAPLHSYASQEDILRHIAITKGLSGDAAEIEIKRLEKLINEDARKSGQSNRAVAEAYLDLQGQGISTNVVDKIIGQHSMAATAYGISPEVLGPAVGALIQSFKVKEEEIGAVLAAMANASKQGRFKIGDFATHLPGVAASFASAGIKGKDGAIESFAALETVMKNVGEPGQAATSLNEVLSNIFSPFAERFFAKQGIDLGGMLRAAEKQGIDPLSAVLGKLDSLTKGKTDVEQKQIIGALVHDETARRALIALLQHKQDYLAMIKQLGGADQQTLVGDFSTAAAGPEFQMRQLSVNSEILAQELGKTFLPVLRTLNEGLDYLTTKVTLLNEKFPQTTMIVGSVAASLALMGATFAIIGTVWPAFIAGAGLLAPIFKLLRFAVLAVDGAIGLLVAGFEATVIVSQVALAGIAFLAAVLVAAAVDIYDNWGQFKDFFKQIGQGIMEVLAGIADVLVGTFTFNLPQVLQGFREISAGMIDIFSGAFGVLKQLFLDLWKVIGDPVTAWIADMNAVLDRIKLPGHATNNPGDDTGLPGVGDNGVLAPVGASTAKVAITVAAEPGTRAAVSSPDPSVDVTHTGPLSAGRMLGRD